MDHNNNPVVKLAEEMIERVESGIPKLRPPFEPQVLDHGYCDYPLAVYSVEAIHEWLDKHAVKVNPRQWIVTEVPECK